MFARFYFKNEIIDQEDCILVYTLHYDWETCDNNSKADFQFPQLENDRIITVLDTGCQK